MNGYLWVLAYMVIAAAHGIWQYDDDDSPGIVFVEVFCWPLFVVRMLTTIVAVCVVDAVNKLFELLEAGDQE